MDNRTEPEHGHATGSRLRERATRIFSGKSAAEIYFIGEYFVGTISVFVTLATRGPSRSVSANFAKRSWSAANAARDFSRCPASSYANMYVSRLLVPTSSVTYMLAYEDAGHREK